VIDKENELGDFFTGATVSKKDNFYSVEYKGQIVAEFAIKDLAVVTAMDRVKLETLLQKSNVLSSKQHNILVDNKSGWLYNSFIN
jgi:hypothetical protein